MRLQRAVELADETEAEPREVVFYSWTDAGTQSVPSSVVMRVGGGERLRDTDGRIVATGYHEVRFNAGMLRTSDPAVIREIRKAIKKGDTITEDKEVYLSFVEPTERRSQRLAMKASQLTQELEQKDAKIRQLEKTLAQRSSRKSAQEVPADAE